MLHLLVFCANGSQSFKRFLKVGLIRSKVVSAEQFKFFFLLVDQFYCSILPVISKYDICLQQQLLMFSIQRMDTSIKFNTMDVIRPK